MKKIIVGLGLTLLLVSQLAFAASKDEIEAGVKGTLDNFIRMNAGNKDLMDKAVGVLVFPSVIKAGFVIGGQYGEGALQVKGKTLNYYSVTAGSFGLQIGAQERQEVILFMESSALEQFQNSDGWSAGVDGSITVVEASAGKGVSTETVKDPIIAFIVNGRGLMGNISLEGSKFSKIYR